MIQSKVDLVRYLESDRIALNRKTKKPHFFGDEIWRFQIALRKFEYYSNVSVFGGAFFRLYWHLQHKFWGLLLGFTIPINVIDEGLCLYHYGYVVIGNYAKIGKWCEIHAGVNIGQNKSPEETPEIGDCCFIGPGAKLFGKIKLGNNIAIGANSVVNKSFEENNITIAGIPAKKIKDGGNVSIIARIFKKDDSKRFC